MNKEERKTQTLYSVRLFRDIKFIIPIEYNKTLRNSFYNTSESLTEDTFAFGFLSGEIELF
jgi:hypothetical protein